MLPLTAWISSPRHEQLMKIKGTYRQPDEHAQGSPKADGQPHVEHLQMLHECAY